MAPGLVTPEQRERGKRPTSVMWHTIVSPTGREKTGYPTQKPEGARPPLRAGLLAPRRPVPGPVRRLGHARRRARPSSGRRYLLIDESPEAVAVMQARLGDAGVPRPRPRPREPDRRAHRLQRRPRAAVRDRARRHRHRRAAATATASRPARSTSASSDEFELAAPERADGWRAFVRGTVAELTAAGYALRPCRLTIEGDLERGSGLSSSAAMETALCLALLAVAGEDEPADRRELAKLCSRVENDWVGAETGLLDQLASLCGEPGHAVRIDFATLEIEPVPLELGDWTLVTLDSGAAHSHAESGYNERRARVPRRRARCSASASLREASRGPRRPPGAAAPPAPATCSPRTRASTRWSPRCAPATSRRRAACSTPRTRACATTTPPRCPRSSATVER